MKYKTNIINEITEENWYYDIENFYGTYIISFEDHEDVHIQLEYYDTVIEHHQHFYPIIYDHDDCFEHNFTEDEQEDIKEYIKNHNKLSEYADEIFEKYIKEKETERDRERQYGGF